MTARKRDGKSGKFTKGADEDASQQSPEWEILPWTEELISDWSEDADFQDYCKRTGLNVKAAPTPLQTSKASNIPEDLSDLAAVIATAIQTVNNQQQLPVVTPTNKGTELIEWPKPLTVEATHPTGKKVDIETPLYPINIAGEDYSGDGYYDPNVTDRLKEELAGARYVKVPYNAAFVEYAFHRTNDKGKIVKIREMFRGPGVYAYASLATSLEEQLEKLVEYTLPGGPGEDLIPGTKTRYNDLSTNDVLFVPGFTYLIPKHVVDDLKRRVREHAESFQRVHQERVSLGKQGLSMYSGVQLEAEAALMRQQQGLDPQQIDKVVREGRV